MTDISSVKGPSMSGGHPTAGAPGHGTDDPAWAPESGQPEGGPDNPWELEGDDGSAFPPPSHAAPKDEL